MKEGAHFCSKCGANVEGASEARPMSDLEPAAPRPQDERILRDARIYFSKGSTFESNGNYSKAISAYSELIFKCIGSTDKTVVEKVVQGLVNRGAACEKLNLNEEALASYDEAISKFSTTPGLARWLAWAYYRKSRILYGMENYTGSVEVIDFLLKRYGANHSPAVAEWTSRALRSKALTMIEKLDMFDKGMATLDEVSATYENFSDFPVAEVVFDALQSKASVFLKRSKPEKAATVQNLLITRFLGRSEPKIVKGLFEIIKGKSDLSSQSERHEDALAGYVKFIDTYRNSPDAEIIQMVIQAMLSRSKILASMGKAKDCAAELDDIVARYDKIGNKKINDLVRSAKELRKKSGP